jgi:hypothetical protein
VTTTVSARGLKTSGQQFRVYVADNVDPGNPGDWTLCPEVEFEAVTQNEGSSPDECRLIEYKQGASGNRKALLALIPDTVSAATGDGTTGTVWKGVHLDKDSLIRVQITDKDNPATWLELFLGVVMEPELVQSGNKLHIEYTALDYRFFMDRIPLYGRYVWTGNATPPAFLRAARLTFNEDGQPDRAHAPDGSDVGAFIKPRYNRDDSTPAGAAFDPTYCYGDFWQLGHVWNYFRRVYWLASDPPFGDIAHLFCDGFISEWAQAVPSGDTPVYPWLFKTAEAKDAVILDFAVTGFSLCGGISAVVKQAGPYAWRLEPDSGDNVGKAKIVLFGIHEGLGKKDFVWGDAGDNVANADPDVISTRLRRTGRHFFNRGYAIGRRKVFEVTLSTEDGSLIPNWSDDAQAAYIYAIGTAGEENQGFARVFLEFRAPDDIDWSGIYFDGMVTQRRDRPALKQLLTWALDPFATATNESPRVCLSPILWRKDPDSGTWFRMNAGVSLQVLPDVCGFRLSEPARKIRRDTAGEDQESWPWGTPYSWNGDSEHPAVNNFRITLAIEADECIAAESDASEAGDRARELFFDGGNSYRTASHVNAILPTDDAGVPVIEITAHTIESVLGSPSTPDVFIDDQPRLAASLARKMDTRHTYNIEGSVELWAGRPGLCGYLLGSLTVPALAGDDPPAANREALDVNGCIRSVTIARDVDGGITTTLHLNGF